MGPILCSKTFSPVLMSDFPEKQNVNSNLKTHPGLSTTSQLWPELYEGRIISYPEGGLKVFIKDISLKLPESPTWLLQEPL